ncbi:MAG TPA: hypothetical protein DDW49_09160 [Deltaproteobacteria bacterium]|nr:MAG: hypothetical protein A2048_00185 [Deltaproteobacteria bacterium GWA2_45_12]HBF13529.1 hypothetical protein [Deltaproteobacteria bacterium]
MRLTSATNRLFQRMPGSGLPPSVVCTRRFSRARFPMGTPRQALEQVAQGRAHAHASSFSFKANGLNQEGGSGGVPLELPYSPAREALWGQPGTVFEDWGPSLRQPGRGNIDSEDLPPPGGSDVKRTMPRLSDHARGHIADPNGRPFGLDAVVLDATEGMGLLWVLAWENLPAYEPGESYLNRSLDRVFETGGSVVEMFERYVMAWSHYEDVRDELKVVSREDYDAYLLWKAQHGFPEVEMTTAARVWDELNIRCCDEGIILDIGPYANDETFLYNYGGGIVFFEKLVRFLPQGTLKALGIQGLKLFSQKTEYVKYGEVGTWKLHAMLMRGSPAFLVGKFFEEFSDLLAQRFLGEFPEPPPNWDQPQSPPPLPLELCSQVSRAYERLGQSASPRDVSLAEDGDPHDVFFSNLAKQNITKYGFENFLREFIFGYVVAGPILRAEMRSSPPDSSQFRAAMEIYGIIRDEIFGGKEFDYTFFPEHPPNAMVPSLPDLLGQRRGR